MEASVKKRKSRAALSSIEKKKRMKERSEFYNKTRVVIGSQFDRWRAFQMEKGLKTDTATAEFLLDSFHSNESRKKSSSNIINRVPSTTNASLLSNKNKKQSSSNTAHGTTYASLLSNKNKKQSSSNPTHGTTYVSLLSNKKKKQSSPNTIRRITNVSLLSNKNKMQSSPNTTHGTTYVSLLSNKSKMQSSSNTTHTTHGTTYVRNAETNMGHLPSAKLQFIKGIPVNTPFKVRFYSSILSKTSVSSVYILLEYCCLNMAPTMQPVVIDLGDTILESMSDKNIRPVPDSNGTQTLVETETSSKPNPSLTNLDTHIPDANVQIKSEPGESTDTDEEAEFYQIKCEPDESDYENETADVIRIKCEPPDALVEDEVADFAQVKYESDEAVVASIVDEIVEITLDSCCGSAFHRSGKNLNTGQIAPSIMPNKMVVVDDAGDERRSSRLQSKGYRLDYSAFEEDLSEVEDEFDSGDSCATISCSEDEHLEMNMISVKDESLTKYDSENNVLENQKNQIAASDYDSDSGDSSATISCSEDEHLEINMIDVKVEILNQSDSEKNVLKNHFESQPVIMTEMLNRTEFQLLKIQKS